MTPHISSRRTRDADRRGFTLMEVLLVLIILVVIGSIVAPNVFGAKEAADIKAATAQVGFIKRACRDYYLNMSKYPSSLDDLTTRPSDSAEAEKWGRPYLEEKLKPDPWGNAYQYASPGKRNSDSFDVWSTGPDGQDGTDDDIGNWE
ncbi:MAG TPA: type II secretion system major pseudopilin GspG [Lacipirellulaceae bacterium]|nr:type II secretion system major pseudopilin GspG [Lacipirellulaceae bacterium]HMP05284.1 type II secretion system major pseudopilin GspG [Lacipirellulaceae bacterium]